MPKKEKENNKIFNFAIPEYLKDLLVAEAKRQCISASGVARKAIIQYLKN